MLLISSYTCNLAFNMIPPIWKIKHNLTRRYKRTQSQKIQSWVQETKKHHYPGWAPMDSHRWESIYHGSPSMRIDFPWIPSMDNRFPWTSMPFSWIPHRWRIDSHRWENPWKINGDPWDLNQGKILDYWKNWKDWLQTLISHVGVLLWLCHVMF